MLSLFCNQKLPILIRANDLQDDPHREQESTPRGITHDVRRGKLIYLPASLEFAPVCREHVLHPLAFAAVGECDDECIGHSKDVHRSPVHFPRLPTYPGSQPANKLVIRFVTAMLIFASQRLRKRIIRSPVAAMAMTKMVTVLTLLSRVYDSRQGFAVLK